MRAWRNLIPRCAMKNPPSLVISDETVGNPHLTSTKAMMDLPWTSTAVNSWRPKEGIRGFCCPWSCSRHQNRMPRKKKQNHNGTTQGNSSVPCANTFRRWWWCSEASWQQQLYSDQNLNSKGFKWHYKSKAMPWPSNTWPFQSRSVIGVNKHATPKYRWILKE